MSCDRKFSSVKWAPGVGCGRESVLPFSLVDFLRQTRGKNESKEKAGTRQKSKTESENMNLLTKLDFPKNFLGANTHQRYLGTHLRTHQ